MELNNSVLSSKPDLKQNQRESQSFPNTKIFHTEGRKRLCLQQRQRRTLLPNPTVWLQSTPGQILSRKIKTRKEALSEEVPGSSRVTASLRLFEVGTTGNHKYVALLTATGVPVAGPLNPSTSRPAARLRADFKPSLRRCAGPSLCRPSRRPSADTCFSKNCRERTVWTVVALLEHSDYCPLLGQLLE